MKFYELEVEIDRLKEDFCFAARQYTEESLQMLDLLFQKLSLLKPQGEDHFHELYLRADRGTKEDYVEWLEPTEDEDDRWLVDSFESRYGPEAEWVRFTSSEYVSPEGSYRLCSLNDTPCIRTEPEGQPHQFPGLDYTTDITPLLSWLLLAVEEVIDKVKAGTYNEEVLKNLPYRLRTGKIRRAKLWELIPGIKQAVDEKISEEEVDRFCQAVFLKKEIPEARVKMTKPLYLRACGLLYRGAKMAGYDTMTDWELFCKHSCSHGRHDGLMDCGDTEEDFAEWYHRSDTYDWGGHRWAVKDGSSRSRISLYPVLDEKGWYLVLTGGTLYSTIEVALGFLALTEAGIPVSLPEKDAMRRKLVGKDSVGLVPEHVVPVHCYHLFPDEQVSSFVNLSNFELSEEEELRLVCNSMWYGNGFVELV